MLYEMKTKPTTTDPFQVIALIPSEKKQTEAKVLLQLFEKTTGYPPVVWGNKIIGFGKYQYKYPSGHAGEMCATGFSVSKTKFTLYLYMEERMLQAFLPRLGKATAGKSCLYVNKLADIDTDVLEEMISAAVHFVKTQFAL